MPDTLKDKFEKAIHQKSGSSDVGDRFQKRSLQYIHQGLRSDMADYSSLCELVRTSMPTYQRVNAPLETLRLDALEENIHRRIRSLSGRSLFVYFSHGGTEKDERILQRLYLSLLKDGIWRCLSSLNQTIGLVVKDNQIRVLIDKSQEKFSRKLQSSFESAKFDNKLPVFDFKFFEKNSRIEILIQERDEDDIRNSLLSKERSV